MTEFEYYMIKDFGNQFKDVILISGNKFPFVSVDSVSEQISFSKNKRLMRMEDKNQYDDNTDLSLISKLAWLCLNPFGCISFTCANLACLLTILFMVDFPNGASV